MIKFKFIKGFKILYFNNFTKKNKKKTFNMNKIL